MRALRDTDRLALRKLLSDDDPTVRDLLRESFLSMGDEGAAFLETVAHDGDAAAQRSARQILRVVKERRAYAAFAHFCASSGSNADLEQGCWLLAKTRYPDFNEGSYRIRLDEMARELRQRLTGRETPRATIEVCSRYLYRRLLFRGNTEDYYDPDNSYINRVLDRRLGIPITLSAVYLLIARRLALPLVGISLPGHFLLKWHSITAQFYIDAFNEGRILTENDCHGLCQRLGYTFEPTYLVPTNSRQMLWRMCRNLQPLYSESDPARATQIARFIALLARR